MDVLDKFLHSITYKFPKGYPDINNKQDVLLIENELKKIGINLQELKREEHYNERKKERGENILGITNLNQKMLGDKYTVKEIIPILIDKIKTELKKRLSYFEKMNNFSVSFKEIIGYKILKPILKINNNEYELSLKTQYSKGKDKQGEPIMVDNIGTTYILTISNDKLLTLLLYPTMNDSSIEDSLESHEKRKEKSKGVKLLTLGDFEYIIDLDEPVEKPDKKNNLDDLDYKVKASYRKGSTFTHKKYGVGKVVDAASAGTRAGEPDSRGIVDWVEVDFGKPYYASGEFKETRIIKNLYTTLHPSIS
jgi:hypothetical protein